MSLRDAAETVPTAVARRTISGSNGRWVASLPRLKNCGVRMIARSWTTFANGQTTFSGAM
jgi:hypothetical protein